MIAALTTNELILLALTPVEKWQAARNLNNSGGFVTTQIAIYIGIALLIALVLLFVWASYKRLAHRKKISMQFFDNAQKRGLSQREALILYHIAKTAELNDVGTIYHLNKVFEHGVLAMCEQAKSGKLESEEVEHLIAEIAVLREKLGFNRKRGATGLDIKSNNITTHNFEVGQQVSMTRRLGSESYEINGTVTKNNNLGIEVELSEPLTKHHGHQWRVRCYSGKYVLEFDTRSIGGDENTMLLNHSHDVRPINRRRYHRVSVELKAYMAAFPFEKQIYQESDDGIDSFESNPVLPKFLPVVVTELAGPGLRIETSIELLVNQRVALVFYLPSDNNQPDQKKVIRVVEDIGEVRHCQEIEKGYSAAIELTGLNEKDINELVRATNIAAVQSNEKTKDSDTEEKKEGEIVAAASSEENGQ